MLVELGWKILAVTGYKRELKWTALHTGVLKQYRAQGAVL
jgi:hypothetical protein